MAALYPEYEQLNLPQLQEEILAYWEREKTFRASVESRPADKPFVFYEGPPSANGKPGIHHVMSRTIKDLFCRYKTLKGYRVERKAGWDTHGLPVELGVEKELGITKEDIGKSISVAEYNAACKEAVMRYTDLWNELTRQMGYWVDMENPYLTYRAQYMETLWWLLKQLWDKDLLYKGYTIQPYSPKAGTGLSSHELNMPGSYREVKDTSCIAQFLLCQDERFAATFSAVEIGDLPVYLLAWTTTPWTLPSNTALTVGLRIGYEMIECLNQYTGKRQLVVLASDRISAYFGPAQEQAEAFAVPTGKTAKGGPWRRHWQGVGADLLELRYEQILPWATPDAGKEQAFRVISGDFVTTEDGTGIVHTAPTFGADDARVAREAKPPVPPMLVRDENDNLVPLVDLQGRFRAEVGPLGGRYVKNEYYPAGEAPEKSTDVEIAIILKEENKAFRVEKYLHSYPHCWRTDKPVLYYPLDAWFIRVTAAKEELVALNRQINWKPASTGEGRFGNWLENANDWNLSRSRYWGTPLPIWSTEDGTERRIFGSIAELKEACEEAVEAGFMPSNPLADFEPGNFSEENYGRVDLHRHVVDQIVLPSQDGKAMHRESDLIDVWFDSGAMPYAQWHLPFENEEIFKAHFPADFIAEGVDQTRGWFYTLHTLGTLVFGKPAFKNVVSNGLVLDAQGQKMSKRLGNAIDPFRAMEDYGSDALRWYMISNAQPWENLKFDLQGVEEVRRRFFGTLHNVYAFFALYANIDRYQPSPERAHNLKDRPELDRWILSRLEELGQEVDRCFAAYEPTLAARAMEFFVDEELSNWYVRLNRRRFWKGTMGLDKEMAYDTLYECLRCLAQWMSPLAPFYAERLHMDLTHGLVQEGPASVHLTYWPEPRPDRIDRRLNERMALARKLSSMALALRKREKIKVRQPLQKIVVPALSDEQAELLNSISEIVCRETNVKELEVLRDAGQVLVKSLKPDFKKLGPRFGKQMRALAAAIKALDQQDIARLEWEGELRVSIGEESITLYRDEIEVLTEDIPGWTAYSQDGLTLALDLQISPALKEEGLARELVNRVQNLRKERGLAVTDRIALALGGDPQWEKVLASQGESIAEEVLARQLQWRPTTEGGIELELDGLPLRLQLEIIKGE